MTEPETTKDEVELITTVERFDETVLQRCCPDELIDVSRVPAAVIRRILGAFVAAAEEVDKLKKVIIYNKPCPRDWAQDGEGGVSVDMTDIPPQLLHATLGIADEAGEIVHALFQAMFNQRELDKINLQEECGDSEWYWSLLRQTTGITHEELWTQNNAKLAERYKPKDEEGSDFTSEEALNRDTDAERVHLEANAAGGDDTDSAGGGTGDSADEESDEPAVDDEADAGGGGTADAKAEAGEPGTVGDTVLTDVIPDDLTKLPKIGPARQTELNELGILTYGGVADPSNKDAIIALDGIDDENYLEVVAKAKELAG